MTRPHIHTFAAAATFFAFALASHATTITTAGQPAQLAIRTAGEHSIRVTLKPVGFEEEFPFTPALAERAYPAPAIRLREIDGTVRGQVGRLHVEVRSEPLRVIVTKVDGKPVQDVIFEQDGKLSFKLDEQPVLGMGEGGPPMGSDWRNQPIEFDRRGRRHEMQPRWQSNAYGSRNPVALMIGTEGWGLFVATPWGHVDLAGEDRGTFTPWQPPAAGSGRDPRETTRQIQGRPPVESIVPGMYDVFIFDAHDPVEFMKDVSIIAGPAVLPPKWSLGYMQSHRTLEDESQMLRIVDTFRKKRIPLDTVIYLGTGFCPRGWNTEQPSFTFNPEVFRRNPKDVLADLHERNVKVVVHMVPWQRDRLPTLQGMIPPLPGEILDESHVLNYWQQHVDLFTAGIDAFWPDEGDWLNLFERIKRHQMYYQGPLSTRPNVRPWSLHRNGHLGIARWGGWVWSGDTDSAWRTLEGQVAVGLNHSLSLSPYWGSDIGGFYPDEELTGELYARWFQFAAFCPSFRSHGRTWWTRLPWGWGLGEMGPLENERGGGNPLPSELNNHAIEPVCRQYAELRYQLMPYTYTLAWQAYSTGMPFMRAMWLHYPDDRRVAGMGSQYLWGRDLLVAPVFEQGANSRDVYLPAGEWYDWWTNAKETGGRTVKREVDLTTMPIYVRAGAIIPFDPVRQYTSQPVDEPMTIKVYRGANGRFTLYEDDGISLDYLQNEGSTWTRITWDEAARKLTIEPGAPGGVANLVSNRTFKVELLPEGRTKEVRYTGQRVEVTF